MIIFVSLPAIGQLTNQSHAEEQGVEKGIEIGLKKGKAEGIEIGKNEMRISTPAI